jgi:lipopolysaccharide transport system ATP-binding protein
LRDGEFYAVRDVSFELRRGECLGLIGHNGAGKTTLLKMLNGLIKPDAGTITMRGRVGALIALGAGFNPILTGRENIYINGSVLGLSKKEIDGKIDEIIDFAEIGEFIDSPVQNYSSGMSVRLGFSIASSLSPDVLILDEVLAVGDIGFVIKCLNRVRQLTANAAVILVTHQMQFVSSFCSRVLFMDHGQVDVDADDPKDAIDRYYSLVSEDKNVAGLGTVVIDAVTMRGFNEEGNPSGDTLAQGTSACVDVEFTVREEGEAALLSLSIDDIGYAQVITCPLVDGSGQPLEFGKGRHKVSVDLGKVELNSGKYSILVYAAGAVTRHLLVRSQGNAPFRVIAKNNAWSKLVRPIVPTTGK